MARIYRDQLEAGKSLVIPTGTIVAPVAATETLAFTNSVADGELVVIGPHIYEFDTDDVVAEGNIKVDVSGGATNTAAVTALLSAIGANTESVVTGASANSGKSAKVTAKVKGVVGNAIIVDTDCENGEWGGETLKDGVDGTVGVKGSMLLVGNDLYVSVDESTTTTSNWKKTALTT